MSNMTDNRLLEILAAYGASPLNWPEDERSAAETLLEAHPERFSNAIAEAQLMDDELGALPSAELPKGLIENIIASAPTEEQARLRSSLDFSTWRLPLWASGFATACLALGMAVGYTMPISENGDYDPSEVALTYALFDADFSAFSEETDG